MTAREVASAIVELAHTVTMKNGKIIAPADEGAILIEEYATRIYQSKTSYVTNVLLPCPFCGSEAFIEVGEPHKHRIATFMPDSTGYVAISCGRCSASIITDGPDISSAIATWNKRSSDVSLNIEGAK